MRGLYIIRKRTEKRWVGYNRFMPCRRPFDPYVIGAISLWVVIMVGTPIVIWIMGTSSLVTCIQLGVLSQAFAVSVIIFRLAEKRTVLLNLLPIIPLAWAVELIGSTTGLPFGVYAYTETLQPQLGGVPLIIPFAWLMMLPPAWGVASIIVRESKSRAPAVLHLTRAITAAVAFTAWDLFLDPQMVGWRFWEWKSYGLYFGIPLTNYLGWFLVSFIISLILMPRHLPTYPLLIVYSITWFLQSIGQFFFWRLPGPAFFGSFTMGSLILLAIIMRKNDFRNI